VTTKKRDKTYEIVQRTQCAVGREEGEGRNLPSDLGLELLADKLEREPIRVTQCMHA
jgi:hypothetical protein